MGSIRENFAENVAFELHHKKQIGFIYEYYYLLWSTSFHVVCKWHLLLFAKAQWMYTHFF